MPSVKDLIEFMSTTWPVALGVFLASLGILAADLIQLSYLATLPSWLPGVAFLVALLSGSVLSVAFIRLVLQVVSAPFRRRRADAWRRKHVAGLDGLSGPEKWLLAWAVANETQVISTDYFNEHVRGLAARGYLVLTGGTHLTNKTAMMIPDHIWEAIKEDLRGENLSSLIGQRPFDRW